MNYEEKNTNRPMVVVEQQNHIRHGGWYGHYNNGMDVASQSFSWDFHSTRSRYFYAADHRMDSLHGQANRHGHVALCRCRGHACSRCLPSFFPGCPLVHGATLEEFGAHSGCDVLSSRPDPSGFGRYALSSLRENDLWGQLVKRCDTFDEGPTCFRLGIEFGDIDLADSTALGWRTAGVADQHAVASQKRGNFD